jgi:lysozyme family protein
MTPNAIKAIERVLGVEGGYVNDPNDSGGETSWGITEYVARRNGYTGPMNRLPLKTAVEIYHKDYWRPLNLDAVAAATTFDIADELFEQGVNMGVYRAGEHLQRILNVMNRQGHLWPDIMVDGDIGPATLGALRAYARSRGSNGMRVLLVALNVMQGAFYIALAERRQKDENFLWGWFLQRVKL